jgi:hypothetical protein
MHLNQTPMLDDTSVLQWARNPTFSFSPRMWPDRGALSERGELDGPK